MQDTTVRCGKALSKIAADDMEFRRLINEIFFRMLGVL